MRNWRRILGIGLPLLALIGGGAYLYKISASLAGSGQSPLAGWQGIQNPRGQFPGQNRITLLLIGKDYNYTGKDIKFSKASRSDTIMLMALDLDQKTMAAVSIPRDSHVIAPDGQEGKINGTFARGGIKLLEKTLNKEFGVTPDYYVIIKDDAVKNIVNVLGGVDVETIDAMKYDDHWGQLHIDLPKGRQHVSGEQAVGFVRYREVNTFRLDSAGNKIPLKNVQHSLEEGDLRRTARQQQMIKAMLASATSPANLLRAPDVIKVSFGQFETNLKQSQMLGLATLFKGANHQEMLSATLPGTSVKKSWGTVFDLDKKRSQALIDWLIRGQEGRAKDTLTVSIYNGTTIDGAAKKTAALLAKKGFLASNEGNVGDVVDLTTVIYHKSAFESIAKQIAREIGATKVVKQASDAQDAANEIVVNIGLDYLALQKPAPKPTVSPSPAG